MSLLGLDVGTTGCKALLFSTDGRMLASAYEEYDRRSPEPGWAELDAPAIWELVQRMTARVVSQSAADPVTSLAVSSMGEAVVPISRDRRILGPTLLNFDARGAEYLEGVRAVLDGESLYQINGNTFGNHFSMTKLMWIRDHQPELYTRTDKFLPWSSFIAFMFGADPIVDYSLAHRTLLFDIERATWSEEMLRISGIDPGKLPRLAPAGVEIGTVSARIAKELGLTPRVTIVNGTHDQCANAVGGGAIEVGRALYGMGSYHCISPIFHGRRESSAMMARGLNTEHHAVPGSYITFVYNHGGTLFKWFRDTFAVMEHRQAKAGQKDIYSLLAAEMPRRLSSVLVLPNFAPTGPPEFLTDTCGAVIGLHLDTSRADILKGILEAIAFYLKEGVDALPAVDISIDEYRVVGGGSKSEAWIQISADILGRPFTRPVISEAGALGSAIMAGVGSGVFQDYPTGVQAMVRLDRTFEPDLAQHARYLARFEQYHQIYARMKEPMQEFHRGDHLGQGSPS
jgi:xylulokinase